MTVEDVWKEINEMSEEDIEDIRDRCDALLDALKIDKEREQEEG